MAGWKRYVFWIVLVGFLVLVVAYDQSAFYLYVPRLGALLVAVVVVCPALYFLGADKRVAFGAMVLAAVSPFVVAPFPGTTLKRFYLDCSAIEQGETREQVAARMQGYSTSLKAWGADQPSAITEGATESGETPYIYTPSPAHDADFCMVYLADGVVDRVVISPD